ncbi:MAG: molybdopterin-binding protein [Egibacteraceae bacterium]
MTARLRVSILVIGDEILGGFVADTNSGWLAQRLQTVGVPLDRVVTIPDDVSAIDEALQTELARTRPRVLLTSGGIGSTPDDVTVEAVATSLGRGLEVHPDLDARITASLARTEAAGVPVSDEHAQSLRTMARVPGGAYLLRTAADQATALSPGVAVDVDGGSGADGGATIVILPGIPSLLQRITIDSVEPALLAGRGRPDHVVERTHGYPESTLTPMLQRLTATFPDVHVGSYPGRECLVRLQGPRARVEAADAVLAAYLEQLAADPASDGLRDLWQSRWRD